ncbi:hypothetical protein G6O69_06100 [Pseudenhygromyxa sp. WMMC2535]|uniref:hypothetical protein n=1 Tax=Pseudenhygromyxa sp. WMMC2535 TaxID=2712867 RepID=UPI0015528658|nr:hypothetical protein [Pseudenhygromyxa sp. WMMC2535]NVB37396.1 hypothetical protein [Pseudenhygromyxa sp. WMMC2535]
MTIKPRQLKEDRKLKQAIDMCQKGAPPVDIEYKLERGEAAEDAAEFLRKKQPPVVTFVD